MSIQVKMNMFMIELKRTSLEQASYATRIFNPDWIVKIIRLMSMTKTSSTPRFIIASGKCRNLILFEKYRDKAVIVIIKTI